MAAQEQSYKLSNLQLELLKIFSRNISDEQLLEIKGILSRYFADKASMNLRSWLNKEDGPLKPIKNGPTNITVQYPNK